MDGTMLAGASLVFVGLYALLVVLFHLYFAYGLQMVADRQEQPELVRMLAWIPMLQVYTVVRCGGGRLGRFLLLAVGGGIGVAVLVPVAGSLVGESALLALLPALWALALFGYGLSLSWRIAEDQGLSGAVSLLLLLPVINLVAWWMIAYRGGLEPVQKVGLVLGLVLVAGPLVPLVTTFASAGPMALAMAQGASSSGGPPGSSEALAELRRAMEEARKASASAGSARASGAGGRAAGAASGFDARYSPETGRCPPGSVRHGVRGDEQWCAKEGSNGRVRHGWYVKWHESGVRAVQGSYRDGRRTGTWMRWHESGRKSVEAPFRDGEQHGVMRRWSPYGELTSEVLYRDGEPVGAPER